MANWHTQEKGIKELRNPLINLIIANTLTQPSVMERYEIVKKSIINLIIANTLTQPSVSHKKQNQKHPFWIQLLQNDSQNHPWVKRNKN